MSDRRDVTADTDAEYEGPDRTLHEHAPDDAGRRPDPEVGAEPAALPDYEDAGRAASLWSDAWRQLRRSPMFIISGSLIVLFIVMAIAPGLFTNADPNACNLSNSVEPPSAEHWFGYDLQGCDYYARTIYGARVSVSIGLVVMLFATAIAIVFGTLAAYYGGIMDSIIARLADVVFALPFILGGIVILSVFDRSFKVVALTLVVLGWPTMLRLMRSSVLSTKEEDYIDAARSLGASDLRIMARHILPNAIAPVVVYATIYVGVIISAEAALSYLGVGLQLPAISWGLMINTAQHRIANSPHLLLFPGAFLSVAVFSFILMGDVLRDALDPKLR